MLTIEIYEENNILESYVNDIKKGKTKFLTEKETLELICNLKEIDIKSMKEVYNGLEITCENGVIRLIDYKELLKRDEFKGFLNNVKDTLRLIKEQSIKSQSIKAPSPNAQSPNAKSKLSQNKKKKVNREKSKKILVGIVATIVAAATLVVLINHLYNLPDKPPAKNDVPIFNSVPVFYDEYTYYNEGHSAKNFNEPEVAGIVKLPYEDRSNTNKAIKAKENYYDLITKYSKMYGLDPDLMMALATQESGTHIINQRGPAIGLMQIEISVWDNETITAFNVETGESETILITKDKLKDLEFNIKTGCMIYRNYLQQFGYNPIVTLQAYNMGIGTINNILSAYSKETGLTRKEILSSYDMGWMDYRDNIKYGDRNYIEKVLSWTSNNFFTFYKTAEEDINILVTSDFLTHDIEDEKIKVNG